jgi:putative flippase GtrA
MKRVIRYLGVDAAAATVEVILYIAVGKRNVDLLLAKLVATGVVFGWNYLARSRFVFRGSP